MSYFRALHLSDLHIGDTYLPSQDLAYKISTDIARNGIQNIRSILVTGDIFHGPSGSDPALIKEAVDFFRTLISELNAYKCSPGITETDVLFVPGNHDIVWTDDETARWNKYRSFLMEFYGSIPDWYDTEEFSFFSSVRRREARVPGF